LDQFSAVHLTTRPPNEHDFSGYGAIDPRMCFTTVPYRFDSMPKRKRVEL
jgi:hypothetical protein